MRCHLLPNLYHVPFLETSKSGKKSLLNARIFLGLFILKTATVTLILHQEGDLKKECQNFRFTFLEHYWMEWPFDVMMSSLPLAEQTQGRHPKVEFMKIFKVFSWTIWSTYTYGELSLLTEIKKISPTKNLPGPYFPGFVSFSRFLACRNSVFAESSFSSFFISFWIALILFIWCRCCFSCFAVAISSA